GVVSASSNLLASSLRSAPEKQTLSVLLRHHSNSLLPAYVTTRLLAMPSTPRRVEIATRPASGLCQIVYRQPHSTSRQTRPPDRGLETHDLHGFGQRQPEPQFPQ